MESQMNATLKVAALAALMTSAAAFAEDPSKQPAAETPQATEGEWPDFSKLDTNGDGNLSKEEASANAALGAKWDELDADKNGSLSSAEYSKAKDKVKGKDQY
jgi:EF hand